MDTILYVDADELLFCPEAKQSVKAQKHHQMQLMHKFSAQGIQELRFSRITYSARVPDDYKLLLNKENVITRKNSDFLNFTTECMKNAFDKVSLKNMLQCWSDLSTLDFWYKSADLGGVCPFHYNHFSCDGQRNGGRHAVVEFRCRCKVGFEMTLVGNTPGAPHPDVASHKCHLMHFNNDRFEFDSRRSKRKYDKGDIRKPNSAFFLF